MSQVTPEDKFGYMSSGGPPVLPATIVIIVGVIAILSATFFWLEKTNCLHVRLRAWWVELEVEREQKPRRRALPQGKEQSS